MSNRYRFNSVTVIGAGSWGTALALLLSEKGLRVTLWAYEEEVVESINRKHENTLYLPGFSLNPEIRATGSMKEAVRSSSLVLFAVPSHAARSVLTELAAVLKEPLPLLSATKGIENGTLLLPIQIMKEILPAKFHGFLGVLSGPTFAKEIILKQPAAAVLAMRQPLLAAGLQKALTTPSFLIYLSRDVTGVQVGGALKNVIAIASGCSDGLGLGMNARAALITRGLSEMIRLGCAMGAKRETFAGLSGIGDLILTATSPLSRNYSSGYRIGQGIPVAEAGNSSRFVAEGFKTTLSAYHLARKLRVKAPITEELYQVLYRQKDPKKAVTELIERAARSKREKFEF